MRLENGGMDVFYIDESIHDDLYAFTAIPIPFLRRVEDVWTIVWPDHFEKLRDWRRELRDLHKIPMNKELHTVKFLSGRGRYREGRHHFSKAAAAGIYKWMMANLGFLPPSSIINVTGTSRSTLYDTKGAEAVLLTLFQRMRTACMKRNAMVFFDQGHGEYTKLYRRSQRYLPTGSRYGIWPETGTLTRNLPMEQFVKDGNIKQSSISWYVQIADLVVYALMLKHREKLGRLTRWQVKYELGEAFDCIPTSVLNTKASTTDRQGIVWCG